MLRYFCPMLLTFAQAAQRPHKFNLSRKGAQTTQQVAVRQGDQLIITADENYSTGYRWFVSPSNNLLYDIVYNEHTEKPNPEGFVGAPGKREVHVQINGTGQDNLRLVYTQPWTFTSFEDYVDQIDPMTYNAFTF